MIFEVLLILPLFVVIFGILHHFRRLINMSTEFDEMLNNLLPGVSTPEIDAPGEKCGRDFLINVINQGKADLLPGKTPWTVDRVKKAPDDVIEKLKNQFVQNETKRKAENTGKAVSKHVVNLYSTGVSRFLKIDSIEQLRRDIDDDPIIKDSMAEVGALLVSAFGPWLSPLLVLAHTANRCQGLQPSSGRSNINERQSINGNFLSTGEPVERSQGDDRAPKSDGTSD